MAWLKHEIEKYTRQIKFATDQRVRDDGALFQRVEVPLRSGLRWVG